MGRHPQFDYYAYCFSLDILYNPHSSEQSTMINKVASLFGLAVLSALSVTDHGVMGRELIAKRLGQKSAQTKNVSPMIESLHERFQNQNANLQTSHQSC